MQTGVVAVIIVIVVVAVMGYENGFEHSLWGRCDTLWYDFTSGILVCIAGALFAYAGVCSVFMGQNNCQWLYN